ncbi:MAG TPA: hypothetical protein VG737_15800 [Cyclobacteriaceae bacterium]|nr:hypothetical protein [Cyclobacteriaceae bacterium]
MKMKTKRLISLAGMMIIVMGAAAQTTSNNYWVVEGNVNTRDYTLIRFYDSANNLIHEETIQGKFLDINRKKNVKLLNKKLRDFDTKNLSVKKTNRRNRNKA